MLLFILKPIKTDVSYLMIEMTKVTDRLDLLETNSGHESKFESQSVESYNIKHENTNNVQVASEIRKMKSNFDTLKTEMNAKIDRLVVSGLNQNSMQRVQHYF